MLFQIREVKKKLDFPNFVFCTKVIKSCLLGVKTKHIRYMLFLSYDCIPFIGLRSLFFGFLSYLYTT